MKKGVRKVCILLFWLIVWCGLTAVVDNEILMVSPLETGERLFSLLAEKSFYFSVGQSLLRIGLGFVSGALTAILLAALGKRFFSVEEVLAPAMSLLKTVPVASFVVLLLIWWGSSALAVAICFLVVLPQLYISTLEGLKSTDRKLLEMAQVLRMPFWNRFFYVYRPALRPFLYSSMKVALGMCWKSGVAAEVIGIPEFSIGEQLYLSKIYLDTAGVFAWTAVIVGLSVLFEKAIMKATEIFFAWEPRCKQQEKMPAGDGTVSAENLCKQFGEQKVLVDKNFFCASGQALYLREPSGSGKTTLLLLLAGLLKPDAGTLQVSKSVSMLFQEDRLCEEYSALRNVEMVCGSRETAREALLKLLEPEALDKPCGQLSGGMKRRVALVRAMEAQSDVVLLDEPYTGMDAVTKAVAEAYILSRKGDRTLIVATHI